MSSNQTTGATDDPTLSTGDSTSTISERTVRIKTRQRTVILAGLLVVTAMLGWLERRALSSGQDTYATAERQLSQMRNDVTRIKILRATPQSAASRTRPNEELLAQVERALTAAGINRDHWHDSIPQPAARVPKSDYKQLTTRLYFESITPKQLATFAHHLQTDDPTLRISALNLTNRHPDTPEYDFDLAVSYLVYARQEVGDRRNRP